MSATLVLLPVGRVAMLAPVIRGLGRGDCMWVDVIGSFVGTSDRILQP